MLDWYQKRFSILYDNWVDIRVLMKLREHSDPAETLKKIEERLEQTSREFKELLDNETEEKRKAE